MRRRVVLLLCLLTAAAVVVPATPARADVDVCAGVGQAYVPMTLVYPAIDPVPRTGSFSMALDTGACAAGFSLTAAGTVTGWCGLSSGWGYMNNYVSGRPNTHAMYWIGVGGVLVLSGEVAGSVVAIADAFQGESCTTGADRFLLVGGALMVHCGVGIWTTFDPLSPTVVDHCGLFAPAAGNAR